ncbi:hypothetical protein N7462_002204 [Penicillium macrosclerotiorum]|uniref:uncharacterized protein n=1 Tax=Penicillium macrosclerotiorum TaxID=303699 RepID=UPI00254982C0|nr:uncharacterized protein N7462_002204 [Penicillium macrosclerotiorum]KAJ5692781.1 hypothetical protein N7462_002204 [Penicillium macrosclerotiorum]
MRHSLQVILLAFVALLTHHAAADCNPLKNTTCSPDPALSTEHTWWFNQSLNENLWDMQTGTYNYTDDGAIFAIRAENASTLLVSNFYIFFGVMEAHVKMAKGAGIISSVILQSDDEDEIDWEWVGYNTNSVQSDFFGKGNTTTSDRGGNHTVMNADTEFHNYTTHWTKEKLEWWIDGELRRTVNYSESLTLYGKNYPQTPCQVKVSNWPVGIKGQSVGNLEWGGGYVNWDDLPFIMTVQRIRVQDYHTGKEYEYTDQTGSYESIKVISGNSTAEKEINKKAAETLAEKWDDLGEGAHIGIYVAAGVVGAAAIGAFAWWCIRQRKSGRLQRALNDAQNGEELKRMQDYNANWRHSQWGGQSYQKVP